MSASGVAASGVFAFSLALPESERQPRNYTAITTDRYGRSLTLSDHRLWKLWITSQGKLSDRHTSTTESGESAHPTCEYTHIGVSVDVRRLPLTSCGFRCPDKPPPHSALSTGLLNKPVGLWGMSGSSLVE